VDAILILIVIVTSLAGLGAAAGSFGANTTYNADEDDDHQLPEIDIESYRAARNR